MSAAEICLIYGRSCQRKRGGIKKMKEEGKRG
jgi:hypothetical protein